MTYSQLTTKLINDGYYRVEKDDRLFDVFPKETSEKGIELWENMKDKNTIIVRFHEPHRMKSVTTHQIPTSDIENALLKNIPLNLKDYPISPPPN